MKIWIDADACPGAVRDIVLRAAQKRTINTIFVANKPLYVPVLPHLKFVQVGQGPDVVDAYIVTHAQPGDLVITQDIPLAGQLVEKGIVALNPRGDRYTTATIGERLAVRNLMQELRDTGMATGGPPPFGEKEKRRFANAFDRELTMLLGQAR